MRRVAQSVPEALHWMLRSWDTLNVRHNRKCAFTLVEVLITLGIIGVVAAITLSGLIQNYQKSVAAKRLKVVYTKLYNAIEHAKVDYGDVSEWGVNFKAGSGSDYMSWSANYIEYSKIYSNIIVPYLKPVKIATGSHAIYTSRNIGYKSNSTPFSIPDSGKAVQLSDGSIIFFSVTNNPPLKYMIVDINGVAKPNKYGRDVFAFYLDDKKGLLPYGGNIQDGAKTCGNGCAYLIMRAGWEIKYDW